MKDSQTPSSSSAPQFNAQRKKGGIDMFNAPIPGASLTAAPGAAPYEQPPQFTDPDKAMNFIVGKMTQPRQVDRLIALMKAGAPAEAIGRTVLFQGFSDGKWTPDMAMFLLQPTVQMVAAVAERARRDGYLEAKDIRILNPDVDQQNFMSEFVDVQQLIKEKKALAASAPSTPIEELPKAMPADKSMAAAEGVSIAEQSKQPAAPVADNNKKGFLAE